ncbi:hypothetical protein PUNSTDRAFT_123266 [Punctularia strigosozonata HHB-11173 SS5]|uniref:Uncharacterized protein n=1 Tax=Punctularia strigosozonata (strain HHB-11173) TaxID=741275 RepID=R7S1D0_PUNST|nr:uncharacterized protein PUNSTDRAFT_123266 [Punctularia strigosozonata HHB-11173 SS5]EIN03592.1 hypothetical protein PUNSTDRAFT_123266 [Punctularia strigosozonata HHB-11173 SS5]
MSSSTTTSQSGSDSSTFTAASSSSSLASSAQSGTVTSSPTTTFPPFTPAPIPSSDFSPAATAASNNSGNPAFGTSSTLYLYTFLATLVLLLGVSLAIVLRSLCLRRRHRRMVEEAIRNGTFHPGMLNPSLDARDRWRLRTSGTVPTPLEKPGMMEVHLGQPMGYAQYVAPGPERKSVEADEGKEDSWRSINPISAAVISPPAPAVLAHAGVSPIPPVVSPAPRERSRWLPHISPDLPWRSRHRQRDAENGGVTPQTVQTDLPATTPLQPRPGMPAPGPIPLEPMPTPGPKTATEGGFSAASASSGLNLTVLIAMPSPAVSAQRDTGHQRTNSTDSIDREKGKQRASVDASSSVDGDGEGVPDVVFGVAQVKVRPDVDASAETSNVGVKAAS